MNFIIYEVIFIVLKEIKLYNYSNGIIKQFQTGGNL